MREIKCYDTLTGNYTTVTVTDEVETYIKRSYWREDMQDRRYQARKLLLDENIGYDLLSNSIVDLIISNLEIQELRKALSTLDKRSKEMIYLRYYEKYSMTQIANQLGISSSYATKLLRKIHQTLKDELTELE